MKLLHPTTIEFDPAFRVELERRRQAAKRTLKGEVVTALLHFWAAQDNGEKIPDHYVNAVVEGRVEKMHLKAAELHETFVNPQPEPPK